MHYRLIFWDYFGSLLMCLSLLYDRLEFPMVLVANKADLETDRVVSYQEGEELAKTLKVY